MLWLLSLQSFIAERKDRTLQTNLLTACRNRIQELERRPNMAAKKKKLTDEINQAEMRRLKYLEDIMVRRTKSDVVIYSH